MVEDLQDRLARWLQVPDPSTNFQAALGKRHPETGSWLLKISYFQDWKNLWSSLLWLYGSGVFTMNIHVT